MADLSRRKTLCLLTAVSVPPIAAVAATPLIGTETPEVKLRRLAWEISDLLDTVDIGRFDYVTIRGAKEAGRSAVYMGFDIGMGDEA